jgi:hypothetical protein
MFLSVLSRRRAAAVLALAVIIAAPLTSHAYDLPKQTQELIPVPAQGRPGDQELKPLPNPPVPIPPLEEQIPSLLPGNAVFPVEHCGVEYTLCKYGKDSWDYAREAQLREEIALAQFCVEVATNEANPNEEWIDQLIAELNALIEELQNLIEGRPVPEEGDPCLVKYRQCLLEEHKNMPQEEEGRG